MATTRPVGIVSIPCSQTPSDQIRFETLMSGAGQNTGNLLFTNAVWNQIAGEKIHTGFHFNTDVVNRTLGALIIPAANWFNSHVDFQDLADRVEKLDIPVVMIGLGTQNRDFTAPFDVPEGTVRLVRAVAERSRSVSVRGNYTRDVLKKYGISNVTVTGCPSLYHDFRPSASQRLLSATRNTKGPFLVHSTRFSAAHEPFAQERSVHKKIFELAFRAGADLLLQSEPEEISMIIEAAHKPPIGETTKQLMLNIYQAPDWPSLEAYIRKHARVFFDPELWANALQAYTHVIGTRLHATIMALNSGVPAVIIPHDSRTREMCDFAGLPALHQGLMPLGEATLRKAVRTADLSAYVSTRTQNMNKYYTFLAETGLEPSRTLDE